MSAEGDIEMLLSEVRKRAQKIDMETTGAQIQGSPVKKGRMVHANSYKAGAVTGIAFVVERIETMLRKWIEEDNMRMEEMAEHYDMTGEEVPF